MKFIDNLSDIEENYDVFLFDIWGVVHNGVSAYKGTVEKINSLITSGKIVKFISNSPRPNEIVVEKLLDLGLKVSKKHLVTSGDVTRIFLQDLAEKGKKIYHLGAERNNDILRNITIQTVSKITEADYILLTQYIDEGENEELADELLKIAAKSNIPAICANPDKQAMHGERKRYCAGFFAERFQKFGGKVIYYGKPEQNIFDSAFSLIKDVNKNRAIMIGDTLETDILGASKSKIDSILVLTGNTKFEDLEQSNIVPTFILKSIF